ncbi:MAG: uracil-DNA glycosylase [Phycisphaeraceae bacterium]|nr:uracil-DNA glycosylase [Phycisphaeraceae bacterium]
MDEQEVRKCTRCDLCRSRTQTVFGEGDPDAALMFIGEGPGQTEDEQGRPFVGRAGELLNKMIVAMGLAREQVYIANVVKCRPPDNRTPVPEETAACWDYLRRQIEIIQPRVIVALGAPAAKMLLETKVGIMKLRGTWQSFNMVQPPIPVMPTFHPAYLLRAYTQDNRAKVWSDLQQVMEMMKK